MADQDEVRQGYSTPLDNPLVPRFPITFRNVEILTVIFTLPMGQVWYDYLKR